MPVNVVSSPPLPFAGRDHSQRATQVTFDPEGNSFWSVPLPSELRVQADGTSNLER